MGTYSSNTTIKFDSAVSATGSASSGATTTIYTCPAGKYAVLNVSITSNATAQGFAFAGLASVAQVGTNATSFANSIYLASGQTITVQNTGTGSLTGNISGCLFANTP
jgi:hypothetical protein